MTETVAPDRGTHAAKGGAVVLLTLASAQFLMALDSSVMNVSIATVASDVGTTVTGVQTAITLYTLVMASFMITGGKIGQILGHKRAFAIGALVYGAGSFTTALAPNLAILMIGWSLLEGLGAALIMPATVALVASNFRRSERPRAYGLVAASAAIAIAVGPLIGGLATTYASWRYVFAGEVLVVLVVLALSRRLEDVEAEQGAGLDLIGTTLSALGLALVVYGILRSGTWGFIEPKPNAPEWFGLSPVIWLVLAGGLVLRAFVAVQRRHEQRGEPTLIKVTLLGNTRLRAGLTSFFFQFLVQAGVFFCVPLFLSVALGLSAIETGLRLMPLSITLLIGAAGIPRFFPRASPRVVVQWGFIALFLGVVVLVGALEAGAGAEVVTGPLLVIGLGIGALASQLGAVTVSAVPEDETDEVGGLQNTVTNLGASIGTALAGAVLISALTTSFFTGIQDNPAMPQSLIQQAKVQLDTGVPFVSNAQLEQGLAKGGVTGDTATAIVDENEGARLAGLRSALAVLALISLGGLFLSSGLPRKPAGEEEGQADQRPGEPPQAGVPADPEEPS